MNDQMLGLQESGELGEPGTQNAFARSMSCAALGMALARFRQLHGIGSSFSAKWSEVDGGADLELGFFGTINEEQANEWAETLLLCERMAFLQQTIAELEAKNASHELVESFTDEALEVAVKLRPSEEAKLRAAAAQAREQERQARALRAAEGTTTH